MGTTISSKILGPVLRFPIIRRDVLVNTLANALMPPPDSQIPLHKLVLLCASAGYGKTTLLATAVQQTCSPCCWYFLDASDTEPSVFFHFLLSSIRQPFPTFGPHLDQELCKTQAQAEEGVDSLNRWERYVDALLEALNAEMAEHFILALCNYHEVNSSMVINRLVNRLLAGLPEKGVIVIESRAMLALELISLIAQRKMFGLGNQSLAFTASEVYELALLQKTPFISQQKAEQIASTFEGWIVGILLGSDVGYTDFLPQPALLSNKGKPNRRHINRQQLLAYVRNDIFKNETASYEFLKDISILNWPAPSICNAVLEITNAEQCLTYAEQKGLFLTSDARNNDRADTYTIHPVLRELFIEELHRQSPERFFLLKRRAATFLKNSQDYEQALPYVLQAEEYNLAADILLEIAPAYLSRRQVEIVTKWISLLPKEFVKQNPRLLLILATIHWIEGEYQQVAPLLGEVEVLLNAGDTIDQSLLPLALAELYILRGNLFFNQGNFLHAQESCQQALTLIPSEQINLSIRAYQCLGVCMVVGSGQIFQGIIQLQRALQLSSSQQEVQQTAVLHRQLGSAYKWIGNYLLAEHYQRRALHIWEKLGNSRGVINSLTSMGQLKRSQGQTQEAESLFIQALQLARDTYHFTSGEAYALIGLGELFCDLGEYAQALVYLEDVLNLGRQLKDNYLLNCSLCYLATAYVFIGDTHTAQFFLEQVTLSEKEEYSFERLLQHLIQGTIFLAQLAYNQAQQMLEYTVDLIGQVHIQFLHISALLRLAVCYFRQNKQHEAHWTLEKALALNAGGNYNWSLQIELHRYPELQKLLDQIASQDDTRGQKTTFPAAQMCFDAPSKDRYLDPNLGYRLHITALGDPTVLVDGSPITRWRMTRTMELYFFLLESDTPLRKEQIVAALWPEVDSEQIDQTVRSTIYYLRKAIGKRCLVYHSGHYSLHLTDLYGEQIWYDVAHFNRYYHKAKKALEEENNELATSAFTKSVELYGGDYLQSFYSDWCIFRRDQLRQDYMDARHQLALLAWNREDVDESLKHWQHYLALDSCSEKAHYGIMRCYLRQGKRQMARRQYQHCCRILQEELHLTPGPSLQKLYQRIQESPSR